MRHLSPLVTLAAAVLWFAALLTTDFVAHPAHPAAAPSAEPAGQPASATPSASLSSTYPSASPSGSGSPTPRVSISPKRSDEELPTKAVYVGRTQDGSLAVAIAVLGDRAVAYVCDGRTREAWLRGSAGHGQVSVGSRTGWVIRAGLHDNRLRGTLQVSERTSRFDVGQAKPPAGLYRSRTARAGIGWIVLPNGSQVGLATTSDGTTSAAPRLNPAQRAAVLNGAPVSAEPVDGNTDV